MEPNHDAKTAPPVVLPAVFEAPDPTWHDMYPQQAALVVGLQGCDTLAESEQAAAAFINPILDNTAQGTWGPHRSTWA